MQILPHRFAPTPPLRRRLLVAAGSLATATVGGCATAGRSAPRVVVVGGGYGGATAARYLSLWADRRVVITLIDRHPTFISCPLSNLVLGGSKTLAELTVGRDGLRRRGIDVVQGEVTAIDTARREVRLADGRAAPYDRLIVSPGVDFLYDEVPGLRAAEQAGRVLTAWNAGPQTVALRRRLEAMPDGGVVAITIPVAPYRCPPGPYERACQMASYFKAAKPRSKVLILDANPDVTSKGTLFKRVWAEQYAGLVEYRANEVLTDVDPSGRVARLQFDDVKADVLNVVPPMRAADLAVKAGLVNANGRWCRVDWMTMESTAMKNVHVLGDATLSAAAMPKSGHMANQHGKVAAAAILAHFEGRAPNPMPVMTNACYSFVDAVNAIHVASVHRYVAEKKTLEPVPGAGGISTAPSEMEGRFGLAWAANIWADMLA